MDSPVNQRAEAFENNWLLLSDGATGEFLGGASG